MTKNKNSPKISQKYLDLQNSITAATRTRDPEQPSHSKNENNFHTRPLKQPKTPCQELKILLHRNTHNRILQAPDLTRNFENTKTMPLPHTTNLQIKAIYTRSPHKPAAPVSKEPTK
uniref:Uncharacterized protein n=1 Tax=Daucus carota subsp. sativus TaxID=79200 RepID=A0A165A337_DAUCS